MHPAKHASSPHSPGAIRWVSMAALVVSLALTSPSLAHHCKGSHAGDPGCDDGGGGNGGGGGGGSTDVLFKVDVVLHQGFAFDDPTYLPTCSAQNLAEGTLVVHFPRHDPCATVTTDTGYALTDDISLRVGTDAQGCIVSFQIWGQDVIGREGIAHESEVVELKECVVDPGGFTVHVDGDAIPVWKLVPRAASTFPIA